MLSIRNFYIGQDTLLGHPFTVQALYIDAMMYTSHQRMESIDR